MRWVRSFCREWTRVRPNNFCSFLGTAPKFYHLRQEIASEAGADQREIVCKREKLSRPVYQQHDA